MYSLCMAHMWPMYDLHMVHIAFRSAISSAIGSVQRTDHQGTLAKKAEWLGNQDDRAKNGSKNIQRFDHEMGSRGRFEMFGI